MTGGSQSARNSARLSVGARRELGLHLRELMGGGSANELSLRRLKKASGVGLGTIRELLAGNSDPTLGVMLGLVRGLGLASIEELVSPLGTTLLLEKEEEAREETVG